MTVDKKKKEENFGENYLEIKFEYSPEKKIISVKERGSTWLNVVLAVLAQMGGLYTTIYGVFSVFEKKLTQFSELGSLTNRLFLTKKNPKLEETRIADR